MKGRFPAKHHLPPQWALDKLHAETDNTCLGLFKRGSLEVEIYQPVGHDPQQPHWCDELYVVISGTGYFRNGDTRHPFRPNDLMFVPAGVTHRFEEFSDDFATWVIFFPTDEGNES